jgi:hypothetical protein
MLEETRGQLARRRPARGLMERLGRWALTQVVPRRERAHFAADVLRLGQSGAIASFMRSPVARRALPGFAVRAGDDPADSPRAERPRDRGCGTPAGARFEPTAEVLVFSPRAPRARRSSPPAMETMFPAGELWSNSSCSLRGGGSRVQGCCGALQAHAGLRRPAASWRARTLALRHWLRLLVNASAGCGAALHETGHLLRDDALADQGLALAPARDVSQVLRELACPGQRRFTARRMARPLRVGYHDPATCPRAERPPRAAPCWPRCPAWSYATCAIPTSAAGAPASTT